MIKHKNIIYIGLLVSSLLNAAKYDKIPYTKKSEQAAYTHVPFLRKSPITHYKQYIHDQCIPVLEVDIPQFTTQIVPVGVYRVAIQGKLTHHYFKFTQDITIKRPTHKFIHFYVCNDVSCECIADMIVD